MTELNMRYHTKFCECCGRKSIAIWNHLQKQKPKKDGEKEWKGHTVYPDRDYFYDTNELKFCGNCGKELNNNEIRTSTESRGSFWGAPAYETMVDGYECSNCGHREVF